MNEDRARHLEAIQELLELASNRELELIWRFTRAYLGKSD